MTIKYYFSIQRILRYAMITACFTGLSGLCSSQTLNHDQLRKNISATAANASGKIGLAILVLETGDTLTFHDNQRYPMQSVFKFPIAISLLRAVEKRQLNLDDKIPITKKDLQTPILKPTDGIKLLPTSHLPPILSLTGNLNFDIDHESSLS